MKKTVEILFSGRVQRIGFRSCLKNIGDKLGLTGEVENLADGRVRAVVSGDEIIIEKFLSMSYSCPHAIIKKIETVDYLPTNFQNFTIIRE